MSQPAAPPEWWFYHLSRTALEEAAAPLLQKCLEVGWRVLAVSPRAERLAKLDAVLWTFDDASFLPHGQADAPGLDVARQPVLLSAKLSNANNADAWYRANGATKVRPL
ncbi:MAG: DNA polymerase III subunit chi, partial [Hyphomonas sp. 32-62-5]